MTRRSRYARDDGRDRVGIIVSRQGLRHRVAHDHEGTPVDQPGGKFLRDVLLHVVAPRVRAPSDYTPSAQVSE